MILATRADYKIKKNVKLQRKVNNTALDE